MKITAKELGIQPGKIMELVANGQEITVTFRGKALAKIIPIKNRTKDTEEDVSIFGLWKDHADTATVEEYVRNLRKERQF